MILRLNQLDANAAETTAGWAERSTRLPAPEALPDPRAPFDYPWPAGTFAYELQVLDHDEHDAPVDPAAAQRHVRQLIPPLLAALTPDSHAAVLRCDGLFAPGEMLALFPHLMNPAHVRRFATAGVEKLWTGEPFAATSVRLWPTEAGLTAVCADPAVGLHLGVRLRAFAVPEMLVNPLLDTHHADDERWREILPRCPVVLSTGAGLSTVLLWTRLVRPEQMKRLLHEDVSPRIRG